MIPRQFLPQLRRFQRRLIVTRSKNKKIKENSGQLPISSLGNHETRKHEFKEHMKKL